MAITIKQKKRLILITAFCLAFFQTTFIEIFHTIKGVSLAYSIIYAMLLLTWVHYDNIKYPYRRSLLFNTGLILLGVVFFPFYIYKTRHSIKATYQAIAAMLMVILMVWVISVLGLLSYGSSGIWSSLWSCLWDSHCTITVFGKTLKS